MPVARRPYMPVHGSRPWQVGHVDHKLLDMWCVSGTTGALLGKPWLTLISDGFARPALGFALRFDSPSVFSVMCAIYNCVDRHNRFVDELVADGGGEFDSPDFELTLAFLRTTIIRRARSQARDGSVIERLFRNVNTYVTDEARGSIESIARSRELSASHDPRRHAVWTLPRLAKLVEQYLFDTHSRSVHGTLGTTPGAADAFANEHAGARMSRYIPVDDNLRFALSQTVPGHDGRRQVPGPRNTGPIRVGWLDYYHPDFAKSSVAGQRIPARRCSADASFVYVQLPHKDGWERVQLVADGIDHSGTSWRLAAALIDERARQRYVASLPEVDEANALVRKELLESMDAAECEALERRRVIDAEQEAAAPLGGLEACPEVQPIPLVLEQDEPEPVQGTTAPVVPVIDVDHLRSYDDE